MLNRVNPDALQISAFSGWLDIGKLLTFPDGRVGRIVSVYAGGANVTEAAIQAELLKLTKIKPKGGETAEAYTLRVVDKVNKLAEIDAENWNCLSEAAQLWVNTNVTAADNSDPLTLLNLEDDEPAPPPAQEADPTELAADDEASTEEESVSKKAKAPRKAVPKKEAKAKPAAKAKPEKKAAPAKKVAKPAKAAKAKTNGVGRGRAPLFPDTGVIKVLAKENPHREGTIRDKAFKKIKSGMTVADAVKAGAPRQQVWSMFNRNVISVTGARRAE